MALYQKWIFGFIGGFVALIIYKVNHDWFAIFTGVALIRTIIEIYEEK